MNNNKWTVDKLMILFEMNEEGKSMKDIGKHFGISRQRVHQIISNIHNPNTKKFRSLKGVARMNNKKTHNVSLHGLGKKAQDEFEIKCSDLSIPYISKWRTDKFDYLINTKKIEVKFCKLNESGKGSINFNKNIFDILAVLISHKKKMRWFLIPSHFLKKLTGGGLGIKLGSKSFNNILKFEEKWDILQG